jgi:hypothetical protein
MPFLYLNFFKVDFRSIKNLELSILKLLPIVLEDFSRIGQVLAVRRQKILRMVPIPGLLSQGSLPPKHV